jgi:hypothetical protein
MCREVGSIEASHGADDLLRRKALRPYNHEVADDGLRIHRPKRADYVATVEKERPTRNPDARYSAFLCHGFSVTYSLVRL